MPTDEKTPAPVHDRCSNAYATRLADDIESVTKKIIESRDVDDPNLARLIQKSSEAVACLRIHGEIDLVTIMYDFVRTAGGGGWYPDDMNQARRR